MDNLVWYKYIDRGQIMVTLSAESQYIFVPRNSLSLCQIKEQDILNIELKKCGCCGNQHKCFYKATDEEIAIYTGPEL